MKVLKWKEWKEKRRGTLPATMRTNPVTNVMARDQSSNLNPEHQKADFPAHVPRIFCGRYPQNSLGSPHDHFPRLHIFPHS
mmetsp:Transcript_76050/g.126757  ORF Transcript_76050/g.126757 Transcript_76050/m.126757 type:complete len:81 (-) Transcript_76050:795-1037(-)